MKAESKRRLTAASMLSAGVVLVAALFVIVNYFGWKYHQRFDWTGSRIYTLSEKSENIVHGLDRDIETVVFLSPADPLFDSVSELLARYEAASPRLSVRYVDAEKNLAEAQSLVNKYEISELNVVVFDSGDDKRIVRSSDLAEYDYSGMQFGEGPKMTGFKGEQLFTSSLLNLVESRKPRILFTTGHGEMKLDDFGGGGLSKARDYLEKENFELEEWASLGKPAVPEGTDLVVIAGPTAGFIEPEIGVLREHLEGGGRLLALLDPPLGQAGGLERLGLEDLLAEYGVVLGDDIVLDPSNPIPFFSAETMYVGSWGSHVITQPLAEAEVPAIIALARSVREGEPVAGLLVTELLQTTAEGWAETDLEDLAQGVEKDDDELAGPVSLGVAVELEEAADDGSAGENSASAEDFEEEDLEALFDAGGDAGVPAEETGEGGASEGAPQQGAQSSARLRIAVYGDADFAGNSQIQSAGNATLFANTLNWLVERESLVSIPPKKPEHVQLSLTQAQFRNVVLVTAALPLAMIALGVWIHWRRRR